MISAHAKGTILARREESAITGAILCTHCSEPCLGRAVHEAGNAFCCAGCRTVFEILSQNNLCDYYRIAEKPGVSMKASRIREDEYAALDEPSAQRQFLTFTSASHNRAVLTVPSLHCASCVWLLEQLDRFDTGICSSTVDILRKSVTVDYDPGVTSLRRIAEEMARIGYAPLVRFEDAGGALRQSSPTGRGLYMRIGIAGFAAGNTMMMYLSRYFSGASGIGDSLANAFSWLAIALSVPVLLYCAMPWWTGVRAAMRRKKITLDVPVAIGIAVLFARSVLDITRGTGEGYLDSFNGLVFFLLIGRLFSQKAFDALSFDRTYRSFFPLSVRVEKRGILSVLPIEQVEIGDLLIVRNGEVIPCDCILESHWGHVDYSFVTGESLPVECIERSLVQAGGRVVGEALRLVAIKTVSHSELAAMWDRSSARKPRNEFLTLSDRFGQWFTGLAITVAVAAAALWLPDWTKAFSVFTAVLIIACPCALTLAAPITLGSAMGRLGASGIFLKNVGVLLELVRIDSIFFDKTGTLTTPEHAIQYDGRPLMEGEWQALRAVASHSSHPISCAISMGGLSGDRDRVSQIQEEIGGGIYGISDRHSIALGSHAFVSKYSAETRSPTPDSKTEIVIDGEHAGSFTLRSHIRDGISSAIASLRRSYDVKLISGDSERDSELLAPIFGEQNLAFGARPEQKIAAIESAQRGGNTVLMVGDGLNDAGAMSMADVAVAVTDDTATLVPACDIIMRANALGKLPELLRYARSMKRAIAASLLFSILYNAIGLALAIMGLLSPLIAAVMMPLSSLIVIGFSVAAARVKARRFAWV